MNNLSYKRNKPVRNVNQLGLGLIKVLSIVFASASMAQAQSFNYYINNDDAEFEHLPQTIHATTAGQSYQGTVREGHVVMPREGSCVQIKTGTGVSFEFGTATLVLKNHLGREIFYRTNANNLSRVPTGQRCSNGRLEQIVTSFSETYESELSSASEGGKSRRRNLGNN